ncbi:peptidase inhibitor 16-like [Chiloscyllium punctatum]|uniref:peptidase inhibitor 16-like n=1 Tax=Chiloscyllium punctatum TaxID=137246 RepID=UPI003B64252F
MAASSFKVLLLIYLTCPEPTGALSEADKEVLLEAHNRFRSEVPDASNMLKMNWDKDLEEIAIEYAQKCIWGHNKERGRTGENLYAVTGLLNIKEAVKKWYFEVKDYTYETMECTPNKLCGHYTQLVWADSDKVGCSSHMCEEVQGLNHKNLSLLVCNYLPPGNVIGEKPYKKGIPCSECPDGTKCTDMLCTSILEPEPEPVTEAKPKMEAEAKPQPITESEAKLEPITESHTKPQPVTESEAKVEPITKSQTKLQPITESETKLEPTPELETKLEPKVKPGTTLEPKVKPGTTLEPHTEEKTIPDLKNDPEMKWTVILQDPNFPPHSKCEQVNTGNLTLSSCILTFIMLLVLYFAPI